MSETFASMSEAFARDQNFVPRYWTMVQRHRPPRAVDLAPARPADAFEAVDDVAQRACPNPERIHTLEAD